MKDGVGIVLGLAMKERKDVFNAQSSRVRHTLNTMQQCRTGGLGMSLRRCMGCLDAEVIPNSCRNRHCSRCQAHASYRWLEKQSEKLLPINYFHTVFTVPHDLNLIIGENQSLCYNILFKSVSETLTQFGRKEESLKIGFTSVLHTWGQNLMAHYHIHCIVTAGGLDTQTGSWRSLPPHWLFPVKALSIVFRGKFMSYLAEACEEEQVKSDGIRLLSESEEFQKLKRGVYKNKWNVFSKRPFGGPENVLKYLSLYTHRIAISDNRIEQLDEEKKQVEINYKDYRKDGVRKKMWLNLGVFLQRFCQHILPSGFMKIRHYGMLSNRGVTERISQVRKSLEEEQHLQVGKLVEEVMAEEEPMQELEDVFICSKCGCHEFEMIQVRREDIENFKEYTQSLQQVQEEGMIVDTC